MSRAIGAVLELEALAERSKASDGSASLRETSLHRARAQSLPPYTESRKKPVRLLKGGPSGVKAWPFAPRVDRVASLRRQTQGRAPGRARRRSAAAPRDHGARATSRAHVGLQRTGIEQHFVNRQRNYRRTFQVSDCVRSREFHAVYSKDASIEPPRTRSVVPPRKSLAHTRLQHTLRHLAESKNRYP